jgi:hypothetical protein
MKLDFYAINLIFNDNQQFTFIFNLIHNHINLQLSYLGIIFFIVT